MKAVILLAGHATRMRPLTYYMNKGMVAVAGQPLLEHIIVSHHGEREFGAAELPKTAEAMAVYYFDNLSARLNMIQSQRTTDGNTSDFTDWQDRPLGRAIFKGEIPND